MSQDEITDEQCPVCHGSGKTRRFRWPPLVVAIAALALVVLGEMWKHARGYDAENVAPRWMLVQAAIDVCGLVFVGGMVGFFLRGSCPLCEGTGGPGGVREAGPGDRNHQH